MSDQITPQDNHDLSPLERAGQYANESASQHTFVEYRERKSRNTLKAHDADIDRFVNYLNALSVPIAADPAQDPDAWTGITWGIISGFTQWQLNQGYAISSINRALSTVKMYAKLAFKAGVIPVEEHALIRTVSGYSVKEGKRVDEKRIDAGADTRISNEKMEPTRISKTQANMMKRNQPDSPQGRRDAVLMCLFLDHGLRVGEIALLQVEHFNLNAGEMVFYRPKVDKIQTHVLTEDTLKALNGYYGLGDASAIGYLLRGSRKGGKLTHAGISERGITDRVRELGEYAGVYGLSAHDCRHYWATTAARNGTDLLALQEAGGWNSLAMPRRYVEAAKIANEGVKLE